MQVHSAAKDEPLRVRESIRRVVRTADRLRRPWVGPVGGLSLVVVLCALMAMFLSPGATDRLTCVIVLGLVALVNAVAATVGKRLARAYCARERNRLLHLLWALPQEDRTWTLAPLEREYRQDLRQFAAQLATGRPPDTSSEILPSPAPTSRGDEPTPTL